MMPLVARDALSEAVVRVTAETPVRQALARPREVYVVFADEMNGARFLGLLTERELVEHPTRIMADVLPRQPSPTVPEHLSLTDLERRMEQKGTEAVAVVDGEQRFLGVVTRESLLKGLLRRTDLLSSALKVEQERLRTAEARYRALAERSSVGIYTLQHQTFTYVNPRLAEVFGYRRDQLLEKKGLADLVVADQRELLAQKVKECLTSGGSIYDSFHGLRADGSTIEVEIFGTVERFEDVPVLLGTVVDVTERKEVEHRLKYLAYHDVLTGLPNRTQFMDRAQQAIARAHREESIVGVLFLDLDNFKDINDTLGHEIGDSVLKAVADRLGSRLRGSDTLSRWSGDEFCILLPDLRTPEECMTVAQDLIGVMKQPLHVEERDFVITASVGCSFYPEDGKDVSVLLQLADAAMYEAKHQGGSIACFRQELSEAINRRMKIVQALRGALERGDFFLQFQPIVDFQHNKVRSVEALLRWRHPEYGLLSPREFVPLIERNGYMERVVEWIMFRALSSYRDWQRRGCAPERVAVNLSARYFKSTRLIETIDRILKRVGLPGDCLAIEITEELLVEQSKDVPVLLRSLDEMGVSVSVDDFGTGCSSLSYLQKLPVD
ncbi:MAG: diguanylate cyclase, partial [Gammaproteobacteria bacterium]|nr:diguanylate cyclase [Gammaproteobacteria bacterium]NIU05145.1 diguanylate cyclase [Gammaproteobacteria bacterium]NIV51982.1 diguanylate cyclase [Gammaproteobacteria bacterium]NIX86418.1 diguanylate cyclase [Gammaproteobacteria bacterium]